MVRPSLVSRDAHAISPGKRRRTLKHKAHLIYITLALPCGVAHQPLQFIKHFRLWSASRQTAAVTSPVVAAAANKLACVIGHAKWLATHNHRNNNEAAIKVSAVDETCGEISTLMVHGLRGWWGVTGRRVKGSLPRSQTQKGHNWMISPIRKCSRGLWVGGVNGGSQPSFLSPFR